MEIKLNDSELWGFGGADIDMCKMVVDSELKYIDDMKFPDKFGEFDPKALFIILIHLDKSLLFFTFSDGIDIVDGLSWLMFIFIVGFCWMNYIVFSKTVGY